MHIFILILFIMILNAYIYYDILLLIKFCIHMNSKHIIKSHIIKESVKKTEIVQCVLI